PAPPMFRRNPNRSDVTCVIWLQQTDHESRHNSILHYDTIRDRFGSCQQILESVPAVSLTVHKTTLVKAPALINLRNCQRPDVVPGINRRDEGNIRPSFWFRRLSAVKPPSGSKLLENCHNPNE